MEQFIIDWKIENGKIIVTKEDHTQIISDGHGNYDSYYYEEECTDYYGLLKGCFWWYDGEKLTGLSYEEWIKTFDYDQFIKECAGHDYWDMVGDLLGVPRPEPTDDDSLPF